MTTDGRAIFTLNASNKVALTTTYVSPIKASQGVAINGNEIMVLTMDFTVWKTKISKVNHAGAVLLTVNTTIFNKNLAATPDFTKVLAWSDWSTTRIYDTATIT